MSRRRRWIAVLAAVFGAVVLLAGYMRGWAYPRTQQMEAIDDYFEPYEVESGTLISTSSYENGNWRDGPGRPKASFYYELDEGYTSWELSEELREAAVAKGLVVSILDDNRSSEHLGSKCGWWVEDLVLGDEGQYSYFHGVEYSCDGDHGMYVTVWYRGEAG